MLASCSVGSACVVPRCSVVSAPRQQLLASRRCRSTLFGSRLVQSPDLHLRRRGQRCGQTPQASFFGVGAPEAVVVGLVAVVIFGPQGLAEAAKSLGQTVKAFKPTYDELMTTSQDMKSTLETSLGIDDVRRSLSSVTTFDTNSLGTTPTSTTSFRNEDGSPKFSLGSTGSGGDSGDPDIDAKRAKAAEMAWGDLTADDKSDSHGGIGNAQLDALSLDDLQAELERRQQQKKAKA